METEQKYESQQAGFFWIFFFSFGNCIVISVVSISYTLQVPLSVCSSICPPGTRKAIKPHLPICCYDCVICTAGQISNETGEEMLTISMFVSRA